MSQTAVSSRARRSTSRADEAAAGRRAAERLSDEWPEVSWVPEAPTEAWANAAIERFAELISDQRAIFRASQRGAERGAASLSPRPFQGVLEALQNADDLGASELRIALSGSEAGGATCSWCMTATAYASITSARCSYRG